MNSKIDFSIISVTTIDMMCILPGISRHLPTQTVSQVGLVRRSDLAQG